MAQQHLSICQDTVPCVHPRDMQPNMFPFLECKFDGFIIIIVLLANLW